MTFRFLLAEGIASIRRVPVASVVGALLTGISLAIVGGFLLIAAGYGAELDRARAAATVEVFLEEGISDADPIADAIRNMPEVAAARVRTAEEGAALFGEAINLDSSVFGATLPLPVTVRVDLREEARTTAQAEKLRRELLAIDGVDEAAFASELLKTVEDRLSLFVRIALLVGGLLILGVIGIVAVTAQLTVVTRRSMIRTMRLLGAERRWILSPFVIQGFLIGLGGGLLAAAALFGGAAYVPEIGMTFPGRYRFPILASVTLLGGLLGTLGSGIAGGYYIAKGKEGK